MGKVQAPLASQWYTEDPSTRTGGAVKMARKSKRSAQHSETYMNAYTEVYEYPAILVEFPTFNKFESWASDQAASFAVGEIMHIYRCEYDDVSNKYVNERDEMYSEFFHGMLAAYEKLQVEY